MNRETTKYCNCLYYSANALARLMTKMAEEEFTIVQLAPSHAFLLMTVNQKPGIQPKEISKIMKLKPSTVTRLIEKMEFKGYLERKSIGKTTEVFPSKSCTELDSKIKEAWRNLLNRYTKLIGEKESRRLTEDVYEAILKLQE
ncbi:MAG: MarR family transcriptional regulator [Calditrichaeota bacterium]|nr:MAG: MarR family transcriptional regulator [Calditrichota bacterium]